MAFTQLRNLIQHANTIITITNRTYLVFVSLLLRSGRCTLKDHSGSIGISNNVNVCSAKSFSATPEMSQISTEFKGHLGADAHVLTRKTDQK